VGQDTAKVATICILKYMLRILPFKVRLRFFLLVRLLVTLGSVVDRV
jgi:hypothetical protein